MNLKIKDIKPDIKDFFEKKSFFPVGKKYKPDIKPIILKEEEINALNKIYFSPENGLSSVDNLYRKLKLDNPTKLKITKAKVKEYLNQQPVHQITQQVKSNKIFNSITSLGLKNNYQMDIMYLPNSKQNKNFKYLLTCIDVYSRFAFCLPIKKKEGIAVFKAIKKLFLENGIPKNLNIDDGAEFKYSPFRKYLDDNNITLWVSNPEQENKNAIIERFHRTIRGLILKYELINSKSYIDDLQKLIQNYNNTYHSTLKATPNEVWIGEKKHNQVRNEEIMKFQVGDKVRHTIKKKGDIFNKSSSTTSYTKKIYTITKIEGKSIFLDELVKPFRQYELIIAVGDNLNQNYDDINDKNKQKQTIQRRINKEGIIDNKQERINNKLRREGLI